MMALDAPNDSNLLRNVDKFPSGHGYPTEQLPTFKLKNEVIWTNPNKNLKFPFLFEKGQRDVDLGIFLQPEKHAIPEGNRTLGVRWGHGRSADIGKVFFRDSSRPDLVYRDIDIKGAGYVTGAMSSLGEKLTSRQWRPRESPAVGYAGLLGKGYALHDSAMSETLTQKGMRPHRSLAIIKLHELPLLSDNSQVEIMPIAELQKRSLLPSDFEPVLQVRAYGVKTRVANFLMKNAVQINHTPDDIKSDVEDAISLVRYETEGAVKDALGYLRWFARTLGKNVQLLDKAGYSHRYLDPQNITLDCCIVDLDSVVRSQNLDSSPQKVKTSDYYVAQESLTRFCVDVLDLYGYESEGALLDSPLRMELENVYADSFSEKL